MRNKYGFDVAELGKSMHTWEYAVSDNEKEIFKILKSCSKSELSQISYVLTAMVHDLCDDMFDVIEYNPTNTINYIQFWHACVSEVMYTKYVKKGEVINKLC